MVEHSGAPACRRHVTAVTVAVTLLAGGCFGQDPPVVQVERVTAGEVVQTVSAPATVEAAATQQVTAGVSGVVIELRVEDGQRVRRGAVVLRLSSKEVDLAREQAEAAEAATGGGVVVPRGNATATVAATEDVVRRLDARTRPRLARARRRARKLEDADQRRAALAAVSAVAASYQSTRAALLASGRALAVQQDAAAQALESALNQAVASAATAQRLQARAAAAAAAGRAEDLVVRAPFAGVVELGGAAAAGGPALPPGAVGDLGAGLPGDVASDLPGLAASLGDGQGSGSTLRVGAPVSAGQVLFSVYDLSDRYVAAGVDEVDAPQVRVGQEATVRVDAVPETPFDGVVEHVRVAAERTETGAVGYPVRVRLLGPQDGDRRRLLRRLRVGMTASAEIATKRRRSDLVVPSRALLRRDGGDVVFVVRDGRAQAVDVRVLALGEERAAVHGDLGGDDEVVVAGYEDLADGDPVAVE